MSLVVGVDGCRSGWILAVRDGDRPPDIQFASTFAAALDAFPTASVFAIDIPIGLPDQGPREADAQARKFIGARHSSVFSAPPIAVLGANTYAEARALAEQATGGSISSQAWALMPKIREIADLSANDRVFEVHPEVSFRAMGVLRPLASKHSWTGLEQRRDLLASAGLSVPADIGEAGDRAAPDDILDALAACWSASRIARSEAIRLPGDSTDRTPAIWY